MESPIKLNLSESANKAVDNLTEAPLKNIGQFIADLLFLCIGGISFEADKRRLTYAHNLALFKDNLEAKVNAIPQDKLAEPDTQKIMSAIDDAKFCVDHEELRTLFENLIASSLSIDTASYVHPSFSLMIRRMSVLDAKIIALFAVTSSFPIADFRILVDKVNYFSVQKNVFLPDVASATYEEKASSLCCLSSLGLISVSYETSFAKKEVYEPFKETILYHEYESKIQQLSILIDFIQSKEPKPDSSSLVLGHGRVDLTDLGFYFLQACGYSVKRVSKLPPLFPSIKTR